MKTLILGIGNPILRDDGIGPRLIRELRSFVTDPDVTLRETSLSGINLMELLVGFDRAIIIDAIQSNGKPSEIYWLTPGDFGTQHEEAYSNHNMNLFQAIELGRDLALHMPKEVSFVAIEAKDVTNFGESLTSEVERAVPVVLKQILAEINKERACQPSLAHSTQANVPTSRCLP